MIEAAASSRGCPRLTSG